ncbi:MAG: EamA family transporter [Solirubrobacteraceae bacterium]
MLALVLALGSSLCWGVSDFIGGVQSRRAPVLVVVLVSQTIGLTGLAILIAVRGTGPPELARLLPAAAAGVAAIAGLSAFYRALAIGTMSIVAPIAATGVLVPVLVGVAGGERPAVLQVVGILAAVLGVVLASRERPDGSPRPGARRASLWLALVAALGFGSFFVGLRISARADVPWALLASRGAGILALLGASALATRPGRRAAWSIAQLSPGAGRRGAWSIARPAPGALLALLAGLGPLAVVGLLDLSANGLYALATRHGLLSVVAVASSLYPLGTVLLARVLLGERVRRVQELGIAAALMGVVLIAAG